MSEDPKDQAITKGDVKAFAGVDTDLALARWWSERTGRRISHQAVYKWGADDDPIPIARGWQFQLLRSKMEGQEQTE